MSKQEWQPIETAPKNPEGKFYGPTIIVFCNAQELPWPAYWAQGGPDNAGCWKIADERDDPGSEIWPQDATHWMPLPDHPPAPAKAEGRQP